MNNDKNSIRIISFNIRCKNGGDGENNWDNRKDKVIDLLDFHSPDIICFQEPVDEQFEYLYKNLPKYNCYGIGRNDGVKDGEYAPVFFDKNKFTLMLKGTFWLSETPEIAGSMGWDAACCRITSWVKLKNNDDNKEFFVFNVHFDHLGVIAMENSSLLLTKKIIEIAGDLPVLLAGDFNNVENSKMYSNLINNSMVDSSKADNVKNYGSSISFHDFDLLKALYENVYLKKGEMFSKFHMIDFIFYKNHVKVLKHGVLSDNFDGVYPSDHLPKVCDFLL